jgi:hypothetical protein
MRTPWRAPGPRAGLVIEVSLLALLGAAAPSSAQVRFAATSCARCHEEVGDELAAPVKAMHADDVHASVGLGCADCHGGDPTVVEADGLDQDRAHAGSAGFRGRPTPAQIPDLCARCHSDATFMHRFNPNLPTDQLARYRTSTHGQRNAGGDEKVATCVSCHGAHGILRVADPRAPVYALRVPDTCGRCHTNEVLMRPYGIRTDQLEQYRASVHGKALYEKSDLSAPTCNDCHGNHGAAPPGVASVAMICGECHVTSRAFFQESVHKQAFDAANQPECTACHGNHGITPASDTFVGHEPSSWCARCHFPGDRGLAVGVELRASLDSLATEIEAAKLTVERASHAGMEVSGGEISLQEAHTALIQARDATHTLEPAKVRARTTAGMAAARNATGVGRAALAEREVRRRGLAVSLVIIAIVCIALVGVIRRLDARAGLRET